MKILSIDSSSRSTGFAIFTDGHYTDSGLIDLKHIKDTDDRLKVMTHRLHSLIDIRKPDVVVAELTAVTRNPQVQRLLTMILGIIYGKCIENKIQCEFLRPTEWRSLITKDKKPRKRDELKEWSKQKVSELFGITDINDDISDAILIG